MSVDRCLGNLEEAIAAAKALGLDTSDAVATLDTARARLGFPSSAYVLALVGGTGVGKSTSASCESMRVARLPTSPCSTFPTSTRSLSSTGSA